MSPRKTPLPNEDSLNEIEAHLAGTLRPVRPPTGLVQRLRSRVRLPEPGLLARRIVSWRSFFLIFGGVISGMLLILTVARALFHLTGRRS